MCKSACALSQISKGGADCGVDSPHHSQHPSACRGVLELPTSPFPPIAKDLHCHWGLKAEKNLVEGCLRALKRVSAHKPHQFGHISEELDHMVTGLQPVVPHSPHSSTTHSKIDYVYNNSNKKQLPPCPPQIHYPTIEGFRSQSDPVTNDDARRIRTKLLVMASP